jgi:hypothetical protein
MNSCPGTRRAFWSVPGNPVAFVWKVAVTHAPDHTVKKSTTPVFRLYIPPAILMSPCDSMSASTAPSLRILSIVISTFLRATASTNA